VLCRELQTSVLSMRVSQVLPCNCGDGQYSSHKRRQFKENNIMAYS
jgi:hypothetical protein